MKELNLNKYLLLKFIGEINKEFKYILPSLLGAKNNSERYLNAFNTDAKITFESRINS